MNNDNTPRWNIQNNNDSTNDLTRKLSDNIEVIENMGITESMAFSSRPLIHVVFPHSAKTADKSPILTLVNGNLRISMMSDCGLPYGHYPRLIMLWLTREALRRHHDPMLSFDDARLIPLGGSLTQFMREVGILKPHERLNGGKRGRIQTLRTQMERLFSTTISIKRIEDATPRSFMQWKNIPISSSGEYWWEPHIDDAAGPGSHVVLSKDFFTELVQHAFPLNPLHLHLINRAPLAIDLYCWATYRLATHSGFTRVSWEQLRQQLSVGFAETPQGMRNFRRKVKEALEKIKAVWPEMGVTEWAGGLELRGTSPAVPKQSKWFHDDEDLPRF